MKAGMNDDVGAPSAQRLPINDPAQFPAHKRGDDPCSQSGHEGVRRQARTVVHHVDLEPVLVTVGRDRHAAVAAIEACLLYTSPSPRD